MIFFRPRFGPSSHNIIRKVSHSAGRWHELSTRRARDRARKSYSCSYGGDRVGGSLLLLFCLFLFVRFWCCEQPGDSNAPNPANKVLTSP